MIDSIKKIFPDPLLQWYRSLKDLPYKHRGAKDIFSEIYTKNKWKSVESASGKGSESAQTGWLVRELDQLLIKRGITSILDIPCGDFSWMRNVDLSKIDYIGADIVDDLVQYNRARMTETTRRAFVVLDVTADPLPHCDLVVVRDCFVHLSFEDIFNAVRNIKASGSRYLLTTTFTDFHGNYDKATGHWRRLNLQEAPFHFPSPIAVINEHCTENHGRYKDKSMALWELSAL